MSTLALYREMVPAHASVVDATIESMLARAIVRHTASAWGAVYSDAMVWWAAHRVQRLPGSGAPGAPFAGAVGALTGHKDGDLSRTYADPSGTAVGTVADRELQTTIYGQNYLDLRDSRAAATPTFYGPGVYG